MFVIDTENAVVNITGSIDFRKELLNLDIDPDSKGFRLFSLRSPLYVKGSFKKPDAGVHVGPLARESLRHPADGNAQARPGAAPLGVNCQ
ncbi:Uncharacterized protein involved in outer membrane biogenesis [Bordetella pertussis]|nr:Uncharacterized protein involved in outer membrane biogenesis [Bordetella pertussis]